MQDDDKLLNALDFLRAYRSKTAGRHLNQTTLARIRNWLARMNGRDVGGLSLTRDTYGWCSIVYVG